jgi:glutamyl/glutaminyl-tRNA synthetase
MYLHLVRGADGKKLSKTTTLVFLTDFAYASITTEVLITFCQESNFSL